MELEITGNDLTIETLVRAARAETLRINFSETTLKTCVRGASLSSKLQTGAGQCMGFLWVSGREN